VRPRHFQYAVDQDCAILDARYAQQYDSDAHRILYLDYGDVEVASNAEPRVDYYSLRIT
jgi:hypothetical protein